MLLFFSSRSWSIYYFVRIWAGSIHSDKRNEKLNYKIREISNEKIPFLIVVGEKEVQEKTLSIRELGTKQTSTLKIEEFLKKLKKSCRIS